MKTSFNSLTRLSFYLILLLFAGSQAIAQVPCNTFVKEVFGMGQNAPRIFKDLVNQRYYLTASSNDTIFISEVDSAGNILSTQELEFTGEFGIVLTDMIVDSTDGMLAAVAKGLGRNFIFKYDYAAAAFSWVNDYANNILFENIHQVSTTTYVVTGEQLGSRMIIFDLDRTTGALWSYQQESFTGEFYSTTNGTDIYGACRYYSIPGSLFNPSMFRFDVATGANLWVNSYVRNTPQARIYPVAPIVDNNSVIQLSSGDPGGFGTYLSTGTRVYLLSTDLNGNLNWTNNISIPGFNRLNVKKIINTATGYFLLIDNYDQGSNSIDFFFVVKTDKAGTVLWANQYGISGVNTVIGGADDNGYLFLTAISGSYSTPDKLLFLRLDPNGISDPNCSYIQQINAAEINVANSQAAKALVSNPVSFPNGSYTVPTGPVRTQEKVHCSTSCNFPCNTLSGSLASGVLAF